MPDSTTSQTLQCRKKEDRTNKLIRRRGHFITRTAGVPIKAHGQHKKEPDYVSPYIACFIVDLQNTVDALHFVLVEAVAAEDVWVVVPVGGDLVDC